MYMRFFVSHIQFLMRANLYNRKIFEFAAGNIHTKLSCMEVVYCWHRFALTVKNMLFVGGAL
jgi:hypothetical protein